MATLKDLLVNGNSSLLGTTTTISILPQIDASYNLGSSDLNWNNIYGTSVKVTAYENTITIGSLNSSYAHIYSSSKPFVFNLDLLPLTSARNIGVSKGLIWNNMYAKFYHTLTNGANTSGNSGFAIEDTTGQTYGNLYLVTLGTTGIEGTAGLTLGNSIAAGTAKNAKGYIYLYGSQSKYTTFKTTVTDNTNNNTFVLPDYAGTSYLTHVSGTSKVRDTNLPVYIAANGRVTATSYTIDANVPSNAVFTDTKNTAGSTDTSSKIYLIGATELAANPLTYSDNEVFVTNGVLDAKEVSTSKLYIYGNKTTDKTNRYLYSDALTNIYASVDGVTALVITNAEIRRGAATSSINLGSSSYPWNNIYGKIGYIGDITISGASTDVVARYRLSSSSTLYLNRGNNCSLIFQENGTSYILIDPDNNLIPVTSQTGNLNLGLNANRWKMVYTNGVKIGNNTVVANTDGCTMQYDETLQTLKFVFA